MAQGNSAVECSALITTASVPAATAAAVPTDASTMSDVATFFAGQTVFMTGATGFLGKVLIYKLLHYCPDVAAIYVLIRHKKDCSPEQRLAALMANVIFDTLRTSHPERLDKVKVVGGDIAQPGLGISDADRRLLIDEVTVVFNSAATVKFDDDLTESAKKNVISTRSMLQLARQMRDRPATASVGNLKAVVHVSTAFSQCQVAYDAWIEESIAQGSVISLEQFEAATAKMTPEQINCRHVTKRLVSPRPNTYTMTKAMAEQLIYDEMSDAKDWLPLCIVRPSIVAASLSEPMPGWVDNLNGPSGIIGATGHGLMATILGYREIRPDFVPVDLVINLMMSAAYSTASLKRRTDSVGKIPVYNCTSGQLNPLYWQQVADEIRRWVMTYPMENLVWAPHGWMTGSKVVDRISRVSHHWIPAYTVDFAVRAQGICRTVKSYVTTGLPRFGCGGNGVSSNATDKGSSNSKPRRRTMVQMVSRMTASINALEFFTTHEYRWRIDNVLRLDEQLNATDRRLFGFVEHIRNIDWTEFMRHYVLGTRLHVFGYKPDTIERQRAVLQRKQQTSFVFRTAFMTFCSVLLFMLLAKLIFSS